MWRFFLFWGTIFFLLISKETARYKLDFRETAIPPSNKIHAILTLVGIKRILFTYSIRLLAKNFVRMKGRTITYGEGGDTRKILSFEKFQRTLS